MILIYDEYEYEYDKNKQTVINLKNVIRKN